MAAFRVHAGSAEGAGLPHIPDLVLEGFDGPHTFTLLEVKTFDPCGATHIGELSIRTATVGQPMPM